MSQAPRPFQQATIEVVLRAFHEANKVRRFLVADEVGLGKTVVARGVIQGMMEQRAPGSGPLRVFYVCSSLAIAGQNRTSLLKVLPDEKLRRRAAADVDRLTLAPNQELAADVPLHLYTLTPDTSIPDRKGKHRSGGVQERATLHNLLASQYQDLVEDDGADWLQRHAPRSWTWWKRDRRTKPLQALIDAFFPVLRAELGLEPGQHLPAALRRLRLRRGGDLDAIKLLRVALAKTGLRKLAPDLVIFDEFQRFSDLLADDDTGSTIAREMVKVVNGPAVLLLSATPFRMAAGDAEDAFRPGTHHAPFFDLVEWLLGSDAAAKRERGELEQEFQRFGQNLRGSSASAADIAESKARLETRLRRCIARTERFAHATGREAATLTSVPAVTAPDDLRVFRHLVGCLQGRTPGQGREAASAVAYWSSVPLPMQTLGPDYVAWKAALRTPALAAHLELRREQVAQLQGPPCWPHSRLRALRQTGHGDPVKLAVPWVAPSLPWWELRGSWRDATPQKAIVFSRFRAVPRAVAGLVSYDVERHLLSGRNVAFDRVTKTSPLGASQENLAFFHPSPALSGLLDPWRARVAGVDPFEWAVNATRAGVLSLGLQIRGDSRRKLPELLVGLERQTGDWTASLAAWSQLAHTLARGSSDGGHTLKALVSEWSNTTSAPLAEISELELRLLARAALASAGSVVARSLRRHGAFDGADTAYAAVSASWEGLRSYLNNAWLDAALAGTGAPAEPGTSDYRERIANAIVAGNLESVLDEHLWATIRLRSLEPRQLGAHLVQALALRTSDLKFHGAENGADFRLRAHAALAFTQPVKRLRPDEGDAAQEEEAESVRTDDVRVAFNSPFWPHVLGTTSVGQEGLDFHVWCSTVAHWDLPADPVDLEQREGRVDRYAGLATRRAIANTHRSSPPDVDAFGSPWDALARRAENLHRSDPLGLTPWWIHDGSRVQRLVFDVPLSEATSHFTRLKRRRLLYRLTLGQPNPVDLMDALGHISDQDAARLAIDLSPSTAGKGPPHHPATPG